jgi:hypothetical protein
MRVLAFAALVFVAVPSLAHAEVESATTVAAPERDRWTARPFALEIQGLGSTLGFVGAAVDVSPLSFLSVNAGVGQGISGTQAGAEARFRLRLTQGLALALGVGGSFGRHCVGATMNGLFDPCHDGPEGANAYRWERAYWANVTFGIDGRTEGGFVYRAFIGGGRMLNPGSGTCLGENQNGCDLEKNAGTAHLGVALGYAF